MSETKPKEPSLEPTGKVQKRWYTVAEAAEYLRKKVKTIYNLRNLGKLSGVRSGGNGTLLFTLEELDNYVLAGAKNRMRRPKIETKE